MTLQLSPSSDMAEFVRHGGQTWLHCLICRQDIPRNITHLNEAIVVWRDHTEEMSERGHMPEGWFPFGTHIETNDRLEFSEQTDSAGDPLWERVHG